MEVSATLKPGDPGTRKLAARYGKRLVCVRHRTDRNAGLRHTTVELIVDTRLIRNAPPRERRNPALETGRETVLVRVAFGETALRERVKQAGGRWEPALRLWRPPHEAARALGLEQRLVREGG